jgi:hypothetical protein
VFSVIDVFVVFFLSLLYPLFFTGLVAYSVLLLLSLFLIVVSLIVIVPSLPSLFCLFSVRVSIIIIML